MVRSVGRIGFAWLVVSAALVTGCGDDAPSDDGSSKEAAPAASEESEAADTTSKAKSKGDKKRATKSDSDAAKGGDSEAPLHEVAECKQWEEKVRACDLLKKSAPSLIDKTHEVWRRKDSSADEMKADCERKIESLPKKCR